ncbi:hypothetical protein [Algiphilus sp.]|uniref:hypothetical protein n=1 Tax=Algiphilus sp. TaxID=1872431 RepID=UPI003B52D353
MATPVLAEAPPDRTALYARFDSLTAQAIAQLPLPESGRTPNALVWYVQSEGGLGDVSVGLHEITDAELVRFDTRMGAGSRRAAGEAEFLGRAPHPGPGTYRLTVRYDEAMAVHAMELELKGDERLIELQLPEDAEALPDLILWGERDSGGFFQSLVRWIGLSVQVDHQRNSLYTQALQAPDVRLGRQQCQRGDATSIDGLLLLRAAVESYPETVPASLASSYAQCVLQRGYRAEAERVLQTVSEAALPYETLIDLGLAFADMDTARGALDQSIAILQASRDLDPLESDIELRDRLSVALLRAGRSAEALEVLQRGPHLQVGEIWGEGEAAHPTLFFMLLNYGIALAQQGKLVEAMSVFDLVAARTTRGPVGQTLSDQANHMLGWALLRQRQGREAAAAFDRVSLDGPYAEGALLGRGWAMLTGENPSLKRKNIPDLSAGGLNETALRALFKTGTIGCFELQHFIDTVSACRNASRFERAQVPDSAATAQQNAMPFWDALFARNARDPSVIEGYLAAADAAFAVGDGWQGIDLLEQVLDRLDVVQTRWNATMDLIEAGAAPTLTSARLDHDPSSAAADLHWWLREWVTRPETVALQDSFAATAPLVARLREQEDEAATRTVEALLTLRQALAVAYRASAAEAMEQVWQRYAEHRVNAQLGLARAYDRALGGP